MYLICEVVVDDREKKPAPGGYDIIDAIENHSWNNSIETYMAKSLQNILKDIPYLCNHLGWFSPRELDLQTSSLFFQGVSLVFSPLEFN